MAHQKYVASLYIFLVLSMHPIQAHRAVDNVEMFGTFAEGQDLMAELHKAMHEEKHGLEMEEEWIGEWFATCAQRKNDFERRIEKTEERYETAKADGNIDAVEAAWVTLKVRKAAKTLAKAEKDKCDWVTDKSVDKSALERVVAMTAGKSKCKEATEARLESAKDGTPEEQGRAMEEAMAIFLSEDCTMPEIPADSGTGLDEHTEENVVDIDAEQLETAAKAAEKKKTTALMETLRLHGDKLFKAEVVSPEVSALLLGNSTASVKESVLLEQAEHLVSANPIAEAIGQFLGFIFLCIAFALFCWVLMAFLLVITGIIMCVIKIIIVAIMRLFGSSSWDFNYLGCVGWWATLLGHGGHSSDIGIAICAVQMMTR